MIFILIRSLHPSFLIMALNEGIVLKVLPGSFSCTKVMVALQYKGVPYSTLGIHPTRLTKDLPPPHLVPVLETGKETVPDSRRIMQWIDSTYTGDGKPLYPPVERGGAAVFRSVLAAEEWAHDMLSPLYYYWGGVSDYGRENVTKPFILAVLPKPLVAICCCMPGLATSQAAKQLRKRIHETLGDDAPQSDEQARRMTHDAIRKIERCFTTDEQLYLFDTATPTAADFAVFSPLKRFLDNANDVIDGIGQGYDGNLRREVQAPRTFAFFDRMNRDHYVGKIDWSEALKYGKK